uniref:Uncharacterized protein n=1 Tax=Amazona collaria TaxID=241587 RepID=A0A8B9IUM9_9PSIT
PGGLPVVEVVVLALAYPGVPKGLVAPLKGGGAAWGGPEGHFGASWMLEAMQRGRFGEEATALVSAAPPERSSGDGADAMGSGSPQLPFIPCCSRESEGQASSPRWGPNSANVCVCIYIYIYVCSSSSHPQHEGSLGSKQPPGAGPAPPGKDGFPWDEPLQAPQSSRNVQGAQGWQQKGFRQ